jgi:hypothetical protein
MEAAMRDGSRSLSLWTALASILCTTAFSLIIETAAAGEASQTTSSQPVWVELLKRHPYPYLIPIPEPTLTELDGTYTKIVVSSAERVHCLRCPDYAPEGGLWKLSLGKGVFRIFHVESGWKSMGTHIVAGDRLLLANDPTCIDGLGLYRWRMEKGQMILEAIDDPCAIKLRAMNLTQQPWMSCRPPNIEAAVTEHWLKPEGCD